jgi:hypothetical protein
VPTGLADTRAVVARNESGPRYSTKPLHNAGALCCQGSISNIGVAPIWYPHRSRCRLARLRDRGTAVQDLVQRMRAELTHVRADDILHVSHSIARPGVPRPSRSYTVMVIYRER